MCCLFSCFTIYDCYYIRDLRICQEKILNFLNFLTKLFFRGEIMDICVERIISLITETKCTNKALADFIGIPPSLISDWKKGTANSYHKYIAGISEYFGVSADYLLGRTPIRSGSKWDELIKQYQLCDENKLELVDRLLGITRDNSDSEMYCTKVEFEEDMSMVIELISMFEQLTLVGKSRIIATVADELDKIKTTIK